jgi:hypothetical protein
VVATNADAILNGNAAVGGAADNDGDDNIATQQHQKTKVQQSQKEAWSVRYEKDSRIKEMIPIPR